DGTSSGKREKHPEACMDRATFACSTAFFRDFGNSAPGALPGGHVDFIDKVDSFTYSDFFRDYLIPNHPCIFSAKFTEDWGSRKTWVTWDGKPNFEHLLQKFGEAVVPVANCDVKEYNSNPKEQLPFKEFEDVYTTPVYFSSDWLNEYWDAVAVDDFRFVYMGPKGSWITTRSPGVVEDTISINHNWVNGCNVAVMWCFLQDELAAVQREISQWKDPMDDWHLQCQLIMKSCTGIDYKEFYNFLKVIAENRISILEKGLDEESSSQNNSKAAISTLGMLHAVFDLKRTVKVLSSLSANEDFRKLDLSSLSPSPEALLQHLESAIDTALL
ncbi:hypothetical protein IHE44_0000047, partial [Lamprotornis superbus]